jgi:tripartite-type tricarboxylate transporter receptor subunit TctC
MRSVRVAAIAALLATFLFSTMPARAAEMTRIIVGFPPGQATDLVARLIADRLGPLLEETVIVENRPGQGASFALSILAKQPADGHTMVLAPLASLVSNPHLYKHIGYDTLKDFAPVALVADLPLLLVVNPSLPVKTVQELISYAKAHPDKLAHSSSGNGTLSHLGMVDFQQRAGIKMLHVPYKGSMAAMTDLIAGRVNVAMDTVTVTQPFIRDGRMRLIASASAKRVAAFPDTPTVAEQGLPGFGVSAWIGMVVPAGTPKARIDRLAAAIGKIVQSPEIEEKFAKLGVTTRSAGPKEFRSFLASEYQRWGDIVKASGAVVN